MSKGDKDKLIKLLKFKQDPSFATYSLLLELAEEFKKKIESEVSIEIDREELRGPQGEPGKTPTPEEVLVAVKKVMPVVKDGRTPTKAELREIIRPLIPAAKPGPAGKPGKDGVGKPGPAGKTPTKTEIIELIKPLIPKVKNGTIPKHRWVGTYLQFENPDGTWGKAVNLKGSDANNSNIAFHRGGGLSVDEVNALIAAATGRGSIILATDSGDHTVYNLVSAITSENYYAIINNGMYTPDDPTFPFSATGTTLTFSSALPADLAGTLIKIVCI